MSQIADALRRAAGKTNNASLLDLIASNEKKIEQEQVEKQKRNQAKKLAIQKKKEEDKEKQKTQAKPKQSPKSNPNAKKKPAFKKTQPKSAGTIKPPAKKA